MIGRGGWVEYEGVGPSCHSHTSGACGPMTTSGRKAARRARMVAIRRSTDPPCSSASCAGRHCAHEGISGHRGRDGDWCDLLKAERDEYRQRITELEHGVPSRYRTWPGAPEVRIPSQLAANQQGSLLTDSPLPHTSPAPTSPNTQFFPGTAVFPLDWPGPFVRHGTGW